MPSVRRNRRAEHRRRAEEWSRTFAIVLATASSDPFTGLNPTVALVLFLADQEPRYLGLIATPSIATMVLRLRLNLLLYLAVILVALKVAEVIDWSWGWVLAPLWLPVVIVLGVAAVGFFFAATLLARLKKSFGMRAAPREEIVINGDDEPVNPDDRSPRRIGNIYDHK